jgi:hypothetical protein
MNSKQAKSVIYLLRFAARLPCPFFGGPFPRRFNISSFDKRLHRTNNKCIKNLEFVEIIVKNMQNIDVKIYLQNIESINIGCNFAILLSPFESRKLIG